MDKTYIMKQIFINKNKEPRPGWMIVVGILLVFIGQLVAGMLVPNMDVEPSIQIKLLVTGIYSLITIGGGILLFKILYKKSLGYVGLVRDSWLKWTVYGLALGITSIGVIFLTLMFFGQIHVFEVNTNKLFSIGLLVELISISFTAFSEEYIFRGFIMTALKSTRNKWIVFCTSPFIFSLIHLLNPGVTLLSFVNTLLGGLLFSYMFVKAGTLWFPVGFHIAWNFMQGDILGMNVSGNVQASVVSSQMGKKWLLTGGNYGPEGGILVTIVLLLGFVFVRCFVNPTNKGWLLKSYE